MSPCLFTLLLIDLDEVLEEESWGGVRVKKGKIYFLAYADDVAIVAKVDEDGLKRIIKGLEKYVDRKDLEVNVEKTKVMKCRRGEVGWKKVV